MKLQYVPSENVVSLWPMVRDLIQTAIDFDIDCEDSLGDIYHRLLSCALHLHIVFDEKEGIVTAVVSSVLDTPTARIGTVCFLGSKVPLEDFMPFLSDLEAWAKEAGCLTLRVNGRPAWKKLMKDYSPSYLVLSKRL